MRKRSILIVDDDVKFAIFLKKIFRDDGWVVETADNGETALAMYLNDRPDIILMDIDMPGKNGWETLHRIRTENSSVPVVLMSGHKTEDSDFAKSYAEKATLSIHKPLTVEEIRGYIQSIYSLSYGYGETLSFDEFQLDMSSCTFRAGTQIYPLTEREAKVLFLLCKNRNQIVETPVLIESIGCLPANHGQILLNIISGLRKKLKNAPLQINSAYGKGFVLEKIGFGHKLEKYHV
jgi:DNA-binding response OmpR family regulator